MGILGLVNHNTRKLLLVRVGALGAMGFGLCGGDVLYGGKRAIDQ